MGSLYSACQNIGFNNVPFPFEVGDLVEASDRFFQTLEMFKYLYEEIEVSAPCPYEFTRANVPLLYLGTEILEFRSRNNGPITTRVKAYKFLHGDKIIYSKEGSLCRQVSRVISC